MEVRNIQNKEEWEGFLLKGEESKLSSSPFAVARECEEKTFLSSWNWGGFNSMMGNKIWRLGIFEGAKLLSVALVVKMVAKRGTFLLVPHGPNIISNFQFLISKHEILRTLLDKLKTIAREENVDFIRISPIWERNEENNEVFKSLKFEEAPLHIHPEASWKLDIRPSEEELLMQMRKTTRYLIRQAEKNKDIEIFQSSKIEDVETFNNLYHEVVKLQHFVPFSYDYLKNEFLAFTPGSQISLFFGKYKGDYNPPTTSSHSLRERAPIIASAFIIFWSKIGFYHHAALLPKFHKIPIAYSLLWEVIKEAKKRGCDFFDFWGYVDPFKNPKHPWAGPTLFKMGFGGRPYEYVKTQDLPLSNKYWLTFLFEKIRKTKRGL